MKQIDNILKMITALAKKLYVKIEELLSEIFGQMKSKFKDGSILLFFLEFGVVLLSLVLAYKCDNYSERQHEKNLIIEIQKGINIHGFEIRKADSVNKRAQRSCLILLKSIENDIQYNDSLTKHFAISNTWWQLNLREYAYQSAKSYGLHVIKNDSIREILSYVYENRLNWIETLDERQSQYYYNSVSPFLLDNFQSVDIWRLDSIKMIPNNFELLKKNQKYKSILRTNIANRLEEVSALEKIQKDLDILKQLFKREYGEVLEIPKE